MPRSGVGIDPYCVVAADVNGDGKLDLISANYTDSTLTVLTNNGSGGFGSNATLNVGSGPNWVAAADVNGDGKPDLISANYGFNGSGHTLTVLTNNGSGGFGSNATLTVGIGPYCVVAADLNGDGKLELISANYGNEGVGNTLTVLTNNGSGTFGSNATLTVELGPACVVAADVNGDGKLDLISANQGANGNRMVLTVLINTTPFTNRPPLNIASAGNQFTLYWPAWATNYALYSTPNLSAPNWTAVTNTTWQGLTNYATVTGVTLTNTSPAQFFRLQGT